MADIRAEAVWAFLRILVDAINRFVGAARGTSAGVKMSNAGAARVTPCKRVSGNSKPLILRLVDAIGIESEHGAPASSSARIRNGKWLVAGGGAILRRTVGGIEPQGRTIQTSRCVPSVERRVVDAAQEVQNRSTDVSKLQPRRWRWPGNCGAECLSAARAVRAHSQFSFYPNPGIRFHDITNLSGKARSVRPRHRRADAVLHGRQVQQERQSGGRGFILGGAVADSSRPASADPQQGQAVACDRLSSLQPEDGVDEMEMRADALVKGERVVPVGDLYAKAGQRKAR